MSPYLSGRCARPRHHGAGWSRTTPHSLLVALRQKGPDRLLSASQTASRDCGRVRPPDGVTVGIHDADSGPSAVRVARAPAADVPGAPSPARRRGAVNAHAGHDPVAEPGGDADEQLAL